MHIVRGLLISSADCSNILEKLAGESSLSPKLNLNASPCGMIVLIVTPGILKR